MGTGECRARVTATEPTMRCMACVELPTTIAAVSPGWASPSPVAYFISSSAIWPSRRTKSQRSSWPLSCSPAEERSSCAMSPKSISSSPMASGDSESAAGRCTTYSTSMRPARPCSSRTAASRARVEGAEPSYPTMRYRFAGGAVSVLIGMNSSPLGDDLVLPAPHVSRPPFSRQLDHLVADLERAVALGRRDQYLDQVPVLAPDGEDVGHRGRGAHTVHAVVLLDHPLIGPGDLGLLPPDPARPPEQPDHRPHDDQRDRDPGQPGVEHDVGVAEVLGPAGRQVHGRDDHDGRHRAPDRDVGGVDVRPGVSARVDRMVVVMMVLLLLIHRCTFRGRA